MKMDEKYSSFRNTRRWEKRESGRINGGVDDIWELPHLQLHKLRGQKVLNKYTFKQKKKDIIIKMAKTKGRDQLLKTVTEAESYI